MTAQTRLLGVVGWPVSHSLSPLMQGAALRLLGCDLSYAAFAVPPAQLSAAVRGALALSFVGLNITLPHKEAALALCQPDALALRVGAVNTLRFAQGEILGSNTDVHGFVMLCRERGVVLAPDLRALVLGAGGAARAVVVALRDAGVRFSVAGRNRRALQVDGDEVPLLPLSEEALRPLLPDCDLVVDCTGRGLQQAGYPELPIALLPPRCLVVDLVTRQGPQKTPLLQLCASRGLAAENGIPMLVHQGAKSLSIWLQQEIPPEVVAAMAQALLLSAP